MSSRHEHCWHYASGWTNGLSSAGEDTDICCYCGAKRKRAWKAGADPNHGSFVANSIKVYDKHSRIVREKSHGR